MGTQRWAWPSTSQSQSEAATKSHEGTAMQEKPRMLAESERHAGFAAVHEFGLDRDSASVDTEALRRGVAINVLDAAVFEKEFRSTRID
jgi:hypothetical protein